jgi:hypothetical protein
VIPDVLHFRDRGPDAGETPGHGSAVDEALAARDPHPSSAPKVNRPEDGSLWTG